MEKNLQKEHLLERNTVFFITFALKHCQDGNVHTYSTTKELKKMVSMINSQNIKQKFGIQMTFNSEIKPQKECFLIKYDCFFEDLCIHFEPL